MESEDSKAYEEVALQVSSLNNTSSDKARSDMTLEEHKYFMAVDLERELNEKQLPAQEDINLSGDIKSWQELCRICATSNEYLIPIFKEEGLQNEFCNKINKYLPIQVAEDDTLPLQLCYQCATTLLAWCKLSEECIAAEHKLLELQKVLQIKEQDISNQSSEDPKIVIQDSIVIESPVDQDTLQDATCNQTADSDPSRWQAEYNGMLEIPVTENGITNDDSIQYIECTECNIIFINTDSLLSHMNSVHEIEVHYCPFCKIVYRGEIKEFEEHLLAHSGSSDTKQEIILDEQIPECKDESCKEPEAKQAVADKLSQEEESNVYTCNTCNKSFIKKTDLKKHVSSHSDSKLTKNPEEIEWVKKARQVIDDRISYKCDICAKLMFTKRGFLRHMRVHSDKRPCKCELCGKSYRIEQDLARHIRDVHEGLKKYPCDICGRPFANKGTRDDHRRIHTGERPYACEHCPKTFRTLNSIYIHNRMHTNYKPHKCSYCGKFFGSRQRLTNHTATHTGLKPFSCEVCGKSFSVKGEVLRHRAVHSHEKPFDCQSCGMKFGQKRYLKHHIKQHHKEHAPFLLEGLKL